MSKITPSPAADGTPARQDTTASGLEALALERGAEVVGGALVGSGVNWGLYTEDGFVPSDEAKAVKAALDDATAKEKAAALK